MSRPAQAAASTPTPHNIWLLQTKLPNGMLTTYRTQQVGDGHRIEEGVLAILTQFLLDYARRGIIVKAGRLDINAEIKNQLVKKIESIPEKFSRTHISSVDWIRILNFAVGFGSGNSLASLRQVAAIAASQKNPRLLQRAAPSLFPVISIHPKQLIEAVLHGDIKMVRDILDAAPELLLKIGTATDLSARTFIGTPLQAGISAGDVTFNQNNIGLVEIMMEYLKRHDPENYQTIFTEQALTLFDESLRVYVCKQEKEIARLCKLGSELASNDSRQTEINGKIKEAQARVRNYTNALISKDLKTIVETHIQAQKDNCFIGFDDAINAIENASTADIQAVLDDPTIDSPLGNALKQFRTACTQHTHNEKVVNREHLLKIFELYDAFYFRVMNTDPDWKKRELFWCHLVGWVERDLAACDAQIFANPGLYDAVENNVRNMRSFNFKFGCGSIFPLSFDSNSGLGYKLAAARTGWWAVGSSWTRGGTIPLSKLMSSKNIKLGELMRRTPTARSESRCVVQ